MSGHEPVLKAIAGARNARSRQMAEIRAELRVLHALLAKLVTREEFSAVIVKLAEGLSEMTITLVDRMDRLNVKLSDIEERLP